MSFFKPATREQSKLRLALFGPSGSGKTYTALSIAAGLAGPVALVDTEHGSSAKYAPPRGPVAFSKLDLTTYEPAKYIRALKEAANEGFPVVIVDSLSHAWFAKGGILDQKDAKGGSFDAWATLTPQQNDLVMAILAYPGHVIVTMRAKTEYVIEQRENRAGKTVNVPKKVGLAPVQRNDLEYEFDLAIMMDMDNVGHVQKSRYPELNGQSIRQPGAELAAQLRGFLEEGAVPAPAAAPETPIDLSRLARTEPRPIETDRNVDAPPSPLTPVETELCAALAGAKTLGELRLVSIQIPAAQKTPAVRDAHARRNAELRSARGAA